jgi:hypothetical protein
LPGDETGERAAGLIRLQPFRRIRAVHGELHVGRRSAGGQLDAHERIATAHHVGPAREHAQLHAVGRATGAGRKQCGHSNPTKPLKASQHSLTPLN